MKTLNSKLFIKRIHLLALILVFGLKDAQNPLHSKQGSLEKAQDLTEMNIVSVQVQVSGEDLPQTYYNVNEDFLNLLAPSSLLYTTPVTIIVWIDVSGSISNGTVPLMELSQFEPFIKLVDAYSGVLYVGAIGAKTRQLLAVYVKDSVIEVVPKRRPGQSARAFRDELKRYKENKNNPRITYKDQDTRLKEFRASLKKVVNYSVYHNESQVCQSINLSNQLMSEGTTASSKYLLIVSDGLNSGEEFCAGLADGVNLVVVNRNRTDGVLGLYSGRQKFSTIDAAIRLILKKA